MRAAIIGLTLTLTGLVATQVPVSAQAIPGHLWHKSECVRTTGESLGIRSGSREGNQFGAFDRQAADLCSLTLEDRFQVWAYDSHGIHREGNYRTDWQPRFNDEFGYVCVHQRQACPGYRSTVYFPSPNHYFSDGVPEAYPQNFLDEYVRTFSSAPVSEVTPESQPETEVETEVPWGVRRANRGLDEYLVDEVRQETRDGIRRVIQREIIRPLRQLF